MLQYLAADMDKRLTACVAEVDDPVEKLKAVFNDQFDYFGKHPHFLVAVFPEGLLEESKIINAAIMQLMATKRKHLLQLSSKGNWSIIETCTGRGYTAHHNGKFSAAHAAMAYNRFLL